MSRKYGVTAAASVTRVAKMLIANHGLSDAAKLLSIGKGSLARIAAGAAVTAATLSLAERGMARLIRGESPELPRANFSRSRS